MRVLLLGGTAEASALARRLASSPAVSVTTSLAGRTRSPVRPPGEARIGGFGGVDGLAAWLASTGTEVVVDATHPFAAVMPWHALDACAALGVPRLRVLRPGFTPVAGDRWRRVATLAAAAEVVAAGEWRSVLLTTGRGGLELFASLPAVAGRRWVVRSVDPPAGLGPAPVEVVLGRGPFALDAELALMAAHGVDVVVTKDSGGPAAKLEAARRLGVDVVVVDRPPAPPGPTVASVEDALGWLGGLGLAGLAGLAGRGWTGP